LLVVYLSLVIVSAVIMSWFDLQLDAGGHTVRIEIGLRVVSMCQGDVCASVPFGSLALRGSFPLAATITFWGSVLLSVLVVYLAGTRILSGAINPPLARTGITGGVVMIVATGVTGFLFAPAGAAPGSDLERTWAPALLILAHVIGIATMHLSAASAGEALPPAHARAREPGSVAPSTAAAVPVMPERLRDQVRYAALGAEITRAGFDARREDGSALLVMWRDVVGVVARGLPPEHGGASFVDLVSTAGATVRVLPWTRLTGDPVPGEGDDRARSLVAMVAERCPGLTLDRVTREFVDGRGPPRQLPDAQTLAAHDERLA
jgi:hypothetical protein